MSEKEIKTYPDGTTKVIHTAAETLKMSALLKDKEGNPWKGNPKGIVMTYTDEHGLQTMQCHPARFTGEGLKIAANKAVLDGCKEMQPLVKQYMLDELDEAPKVTITCVKRKGFWDFVNVQVGHVGNAGIFKEGEDMNKPATSGGSGGGWDGGRGAGMGQLRTIASELATKNATKSASMVDVLGAASNYLREEGLAETVADLYNASESLWDALQEALAKVAKQGTKADPEPAEEEDLPEEDDEDDDIPY